MSSEERRVSSLAEMTKLSWLPVDIPSIDDTSYFDTLPDVQLDISTSTSFIVKLLIPTLTYMSYIIAV